MDDTLSSVLVRDCVRLGRYGGGQGRPRPILVKFNSTKDVSAIMSCKSRFHSGNSSIMIKHDLSKEERQLESLLLRERRRLIDDGFERKHIRIRGTKLFLHSKLIGQASSTGFIVHPGQGDIAPVSDSSVNASDTHLAPLTPQISVGCLSPSLCNLAINQDPCATSHSSSGDH